MKDIDDLIQQIQDAANEAAEKARKETLERLMSALTGGAPAAKQKTVKSPRKPRAAKARAPKVATESNGTSGPHLDELTVQRAVEELPGRGAAAIGKELGVEGSVVSALLKKLIKAGTLKAEGKARGTTYYPAGA